MAKIERIRFTISDDINLLMNVLHLNPYENAYHWKVVHQNVCSATGKNFTLRSVKEHLDHLLKLFVKNDRANLRKSGTEEQYQKKEKLLQKIKDLSPRHYKDIVKRKMKSTEELLAEQKDYRDSASPVTAELLQTILTPNSYSHTKSESGDEECLDMLKLEVYNNEEEVDTLQDMNTPDEEPTPSVTSVPPSVPAVNFQPIKKRILAPAKTGKHRSATKTSVLLQYLKEKQESERHVRQKELELEERRCIIEERKCAIEERKMLLEENRFKLEKMEREKRLDSELQDRKKHIEFLQQQQNTIDFFIKNCNSNKK